MVVCLGCNPGNPGDFHGQRNLAGDGPWGLQKSQLNNRQSVSNRSLLIVGWWWVESLSGVQLFLILWAVAHQAPLSLRFPRQEYWSHSLLQGIFLTQGWNLGLLHISCMQVDSLLLEPPGKGDKCKEAVCLEQRVAHQMLFERCLKEEGKSAWCLG